MEPMTLHVRPEHQQRTPPDDFAEDILIEMANLDERDTNIPGTIFVSTALGAHGARVKWYPEKAGRSLPCLIVSIGPDPKLRDDFLPQAASRIALPRVTEWVRLNHVALLDFWNNGASWNRREVSGFLDALQPVTR